MQLPRVIAYYSMVFTLHAEGVLRERVERMRGKFKKIAGVLFVLCIAAFLAAFFLISGQDAGTSYFKTELEKAVATLAGWTLETDGISGNFLAGYNAANIRILFEGQEVARAEELSVGLSILSFFRGQSGLTKVTVTEGVLSGEGMLHALRRSDFSAGSGITTDFMVPVILFSPVTITTPLGEISLASLRLTPGEKTMTFHGEGHFLDFPVEAGASFTTGEQLSITDGFLRGGNAVVSFSGPLFPETRIEGNIDDLRLDVISELTNLPFTAKGTVDSTLLLERPEGRLLVSGEGEIENGDIWDLLMDGTFSWSADESKAVVAPVDARVFSSPASGVFALYFGEEPTAEIAFALKQLKIEEWTHCFSWLSFAQGTLSTLKIDLSGPFEKLNGPILFEAPKATLEGFDVRALRGDLRMFDGERIAISGNATWSDSPFTISGKSLLDDSAGAETSLSLHSGSFDLKSSGKVYAPALSADGKGTMALEISIPSEGAASYKGALAAPRASFLGTAGEKLSVAFSGTEEILSLSALSFSPAGKGLLSGKGSITGLSGKSPSITMEGSGRDLAWNLLRDALGGLETAGLFDASWSVKGPTASPVVSFGLKGRETPFSRSLPLRNIQLEGRFEKNELSVSKGSGSLFGGTASIEGKARFGSATSLSFKGAFRGLSAGQIAAAAGADAETADGVVAGEFSLSGKPSSPLLSLTASAPSLGVASLPLTAVRAKAEGTLSSLKITDFSARLQESSVDLSGVIGLSKGEKTNLKIAANKLDLHSLAAAFFPGVRLGGTLSAQLNVSGKTGGAYTSTLSGTSPFLSVYGVLLEKAKVSLTPDGEDAFDVALEGMLGESALALEGRAVVSPSGATFSLKNTKKIDLAKTASALSAHAAGIFTGDADFSLTGKLGAVPTFEGSISAQSLGLYKTEARSVSVPFRWSDGMFVISGGKGVYHEGTALFDGKVDPVTMRWEGNLAVKGMDLASASERILEGQGKISGKADLTMRGSGTGGMLGLVFGSGQISAKEGSVSGFESIKSVSKTGEIRFSSLLASFNMDGRSIFLLPGSRLSAPPGDTVYRYFSASGSVGWNDSPLDLKCVGDINIRALNAFIGALQGFLTIDGNPLTDPQFLQRFLTGLVGGMAIRDFRETSFNLKGTWDSPEMLDLKVSRGSAPLTIPRSNGSTGKNETQIKITVEIPTGSGSDTSASTEEQVKKQLLENIMKSIIKPGSTEND